MQTVLLQHCSSQPYLCTYGLPMINNTNETHVCDRCILYIETVLKCWYNVNITTDKSSFLFLLRTVRVMCKSRRDIESLDEAPPQLCCSHRLCGCANLLPGFPKWKVTGSTMHIFCWGSLCVLMVSPLTPIGPQSVSGVKALGNTINSFSCN